MADLAADFLLSQRSLAVNASGIRKVFDLAAKLSDPINLSIGQPDFDVPANVRQAAVDAIQNRKNGYTVTQGIGELRERLAAEVKADAGVDLPVLVTSGVSGGILLTLMATLNSGDEVLIGDPYFVIYKHAVRLVGGVPVFVDTYPDFSFDPTRYEAAITRRTKILVIASPSNPTGVVLSDAALKQACELADRYNLLLVVDEIYNRLCYDGPCPSAIRHAPHRTLLLRGFGKSYGMTGWRLGYAAGPRFLIEGLVRMEDLGDDWWEVDPRYGLIRGERTGRTYRIGALLEVRIAGVDIAKRRLGLVLAKKPGDERRAKTQKRAKGEKKEKRGGKPERKRRQS